MLKNKKKNIVYFDGKKCPFCGAVNIGSIPKPQYNYAVEKYICWTCLCDWVPGQFPEPPKENEEIEK